MTETKQPYHITPGAKTYTASSSQLCRYRLTAPDTETAHAVARQLVTRFPATSATVYAQTIEIDTTGGIGLEQAIDELTKQERIQSLVGTIIPAVYRYTAIARDVPLSQDANEQTCYGQRVLFPVWPDNDVFFEDCIIQAVQDYGHYQQGTTVQKYKSATGQIEHFKLIVRKYSNEQVWRVVHFTPEPRRPACEISQEESSKLNTFYSGVEA